MSGPCITWSRFDQWCAVCGRIVTAGTVAHVAHGRVTCLTCSRGERDAH